MQHYHDPVPTGAVTHLDPWRRYRVDQRARASERRHMAGMTEADIALGGTVVIEVAANG